MSHVLELRYRRLLRAYPKEYRAEHGEELIGTLMEAARPGARRPSLRETLHLLAGGFTARVRATRASGVPPWADGLHLGALVVTAVTFAQLPVLPYVTYKMWTALGIILMVALVRGWMRVAAPLAAVAALWTSWPVVPVLGLGPVYGDLAPVAPYWVVAGASVVLAVRRRGAGRTSGKARWWGATMPARSSRWLLVPLAGWALQLTEMPMYDPVRVVSRAGVEMTALLLVLAATVAARDGRWALAAAVYLVPGLVYLAENLLVTGVRGFLYWGVLTALVGASLVAARRMHGKA
ncbi:hypothetical protein Nocox_39865 [Nonomuraea coxensis DSM 45129]|uniref:Integral membrane protein n=1 Tax=Nonomuraea coxensis DSM 45129 TaxID=1122611 RepID=A0ABX8UCJ9_9ACTN|nr:hypothetical protein [Nonomuraea coxensis]QYC45516.1 hypothetical protein Nocox_39865 [Nonomuraea coxensis DSM 45129]